MGLRSSRRHLPVVREAGRQVPLHRESTRTYSAHLIEQAIRVAELTEAGYTHGAIAAELGVSRPRISQIRAVLPGVREYLGEPNVSHRLLEKRDQLSQLRRSALRLAAAVRRDLRELEEELGAAENDRLLGLR